MCSSSCSFQTIRRVLKITETNISKKFTHPLRLNFILPYFEFVLVADEMDHKSTKITVMVIFRLMMKRIISLKITMTGILVDYGISYNES